MHRKFGIRLNPSELNLHSEGDKVEVQRHVVQRDLVDFRIHFTIPHSHKWHELLKCYVDLLVGEQDRHYANCLIAEACSMELPL